MRRKRPPPSYGYDDNGRVVVIPEGFYASESRDWLIVEIPERQRRAIERAERGQDPRDLWPLNQGRTDEGDA